MNPWNICNFLQGHSFSDIVSDVNMIDYYAIYYFVKFGWARKWEQHISLVAGKGEMS